MTAPERRAGGEVRAEGRRLIGTAMRFGDTSPSHRERFAPGSLRLAEAVHLDLHHDVERVVAWHPGGGLTLQGDRDALRLVADLPPLPAADRALAEVRAGAVGGLSVEFRAVRESLDGSIRVIEDAILTGIGLVRSPSYPASGVEARASKAQFNAFTKAFANAFLASLVPTRQSLRCECVGGADCHNVSFDDGAFDSTLADPAAEVLAVAGGGFDRVLGSRKRGTLGLLATERGLEVRIAREAGDTDLGREVAQAAQVAPIYARPIVDTEAATMTIAADTATYSDAPIRAILVKPTDRADGWDEATIAAPGEGRATARRRLWL